MLHERNINPVNLDKILDEARNRKPLMELEEIETLLQNNTTNKKSAGYWKNISLIVLTLIIGASVSVYFITDKTEKSIINNPGKIENKTVISDQKNGFTEIQNTNSDLTSENKNSGNQQADNRQNLQNKNSVNPITREEKDLQEITRPNTSSARQGMVYSEAQPKESEKTAFSFKGWDLVSKVPSQFGYGLDKEVVFNGNASAYINSRKSNYNSAWLTQEINAAPYAGKRLKMTAMVKSDNAGKKAWAGIFMNIKGSDFKKAGYDNLYDKNISGQSDWVPCELVMDVPAKSKKITFGLYKVYGGNAWIDNIHFEVVNDNVPLHFKTQTEAQDTSLIQPDLGSRLANITVEQPENLDFEKLKINDLPEGWHIGEEKQYFRAMTDNKIHHSGKASVFLQSNGYIEKDWNTLMQYCKAAEYAGKRLKLTAWVRTENLKEYAQFVFRMDGAVVKSNSDRIKEINFTGNNNWRKVELVLDIPEDATIFSYGILLEGKGKVWMDDISIEEIPVDNKAANKTSLKSPVNLDFEE